MTTENGESAVPAMAEGAAALVELQTLIGELNEKVAALRENELDAAGLQSQLRELNELAERAAGLLDRASR